MLYDFTADSDSDSGSSGDSGDEAHQEQKRKPLAITYKTLQAHGFRRPVLELPEPKSEEPQVRPERLRLGTPSCQVSVSTVHRSADHKTQNPVV